MRMKEPFITDRKTMVTSIVSALAPLLREPYALFGHSMGGILAYEVTCEIRTRLLPLPKHLFISARPGPEVTRTLLSKPVKELSDDELLAEIADSVNSSLQELESQPELRSLVVPILRNDFELLEGYSFVPREPLRVGITAFGGTSDATVSEGDLQLWSSCTRAGFSLEMLQGDHFFVNQTELIVEAVNRKIESLLSSLAHAG
jgi:surfactin synthase thioesterase subunit